MMLAKSVILALGAALVLEAATAGARAAGGRTVLESLIARCPAVFARQELEQRLALHSEKIGAEEVVHVYLTLADEPGSYSFSLGWLRAAGSGSRVACSDELEQHLPLPNEKKAPPGFNKADWHAIKGFDLVAAGKLRPALGEFEDAAREAPESPRMHNNLGAALAACGEYEKALRELDQALKLKGDYGLALANKACLYLAEGQAKPALAAARQALKADPQLKPARFAAVAAQIALGQIDGALTVSEDTVKRWPADSRAIVLSGDAHAAAGDYRAARARYQKALLVMPNDPRILLKEAEAAQLSGDLDDALKRARQATVVAPEAAEAHLALGRYLEMNREEHAAELQFERALELGPPAPTRLSVYGPLLRVLVAMNRFDQADKLSKKWVSDNPDSADCHFNRAWLVSQLTGPHHLEEAVSEYRKALAANGKLAQAHYNLALLLLKQGNNLAAARELKSFIQEAPQDPDVGKARQLLAELEK